MDNLEDLIEELETLRINVEITSFGRGRCYEEKLERANEMLDECIEIVRNWKHMNTKCPYSKDGICTVCNILKIRCEEEPRFFLCYEYNKAKRAEQNKSD